MFSGNLFWMYGIFFIINLIIQLLTGNLCPAAAA
jgi:hypothetical protein